jgi:NADPH:quinone reductase-like Zn-dependent oxidoreductase
MKAYLVSKYKSPMQIGEVAEPAIDDRDVLVDVHAAGVNLLDAKIRDGEFKLFLPYKAPFILGHDLAGVVTRVGSAVIRFTVGDEVYARPRDGRIGTFAERIAVDEDDLAIKPANLSMTEAASVPLVALTAWQALVGERTCSPATRCSSTPAPGASAPTRSSWPSTWGRR